MSALRDVIVLSRPRFWMYLAGPALVGLVYGVEAATGLFGWVPIAIFLYFLVPANVFLYGVNDVYDADADQHNPRKAQRERRDRGQWYTRTVTALSGLLGLGFVVILPTSAGVVVLGFLLLGVAYSVPPVRLKGRPPLDSVSNGLYVLPGIAAYVAVAGSFPPVEAIVGGLVWTMAMHTYSAIPDIEPDRATGIRTTATMLGRGGALLYCTACWAVAAGLFGLLDVRAGLLLAIYPVTTIGILLAEIDVSRAYWYFPAMNTGVGAVFTIAGLWGTVHA